MAVHIIFRSGGLVISMILGWMFVGKTYVLFLEYINLLAHLFAAIPATK